MATLLGFEFLRRGNFAVSTGPIQIPATVEAIAEVAERERYAIEPGEFGSISSAVGFEEGNETPKVHIYLTRGSMRLIKSLPRDVGGVVSDPGLTAAGKARRAAIRTASS